MPAHLCRREFNPFNLHTSGAVAPPYSHVGCLASHNILTPWQLKGKVAEDSNSI